MMLKIAAAAVCEVVIFTLLKQYKPELAFVSEAAFAVFVLFSLSDTFRQAVEEIKNFLSLSDSAGEYIAVLVKILGLALITQFAADLCRDAGEAAAASRVELAGKAVITAASLPVIEGITALIVRLAENI